ncbi:MAG: D-aminoacyl-tRNA deacylase [Clostridia bacterium]|jgi:D-tyrosyl-tRNA(Tyr) deacylase|nr:D-aminoacyl-tRNA deacylase [Clostridia bacterium]NLV34708.1 D-tyrosyl-tRNA(Tyr) deacylase [Clostridiaceae bacterium]
MIAVIQRVSKSTVHIDDALVSQINSGLNVLLCVTHDDIEEDVYYLADKIVRLRIFSDQEDKMNLSLLEIGKELMVISQFTLAADTRRGNRPSFTNAARPDKGEELYNLFVDYIQKKYSINVQKGVFGAKMTINIINEGPVTIIIDSSKNKRKQ